MSWVEKANRENQKYVMYSLNSNFAEEATHGVEFYESEYSFCWKGIEISIIYVCHFHSAETMNPRMVRIQMSHREYHQSLRTRVELDWNRNILIIVHLISIRQRRRRRGRWRKCIWFGARWGIVSTADCERTEIVACVPLPIVIASESKHAISKYLSESSHLVWVNTTYYSSRRSRLLALPMIGVYFVSILFGWFLFWSS